MMSNELNKYPVPDNTPIVFERIMTEIQRDFLYWPVVGCILNHRRVSVRHKQRIR